MHVMLMQDRGSCRRCWSHTEPPLDAVPSCQPAQVHVWRQEVLHGSLPQTQPNPATNGGSAPLLTDGSEEHKHEEMEGKGSRPSSAEGQQVGSDGFGRLGRREEVGGEGQGLPAADAWQVSRTTCVVGLGGCTRRRSQPPPSSGSVRSNAASVSEHALVVCLSIPCSPSGGGPR